jgi:recombination protein RecT
MNDRTNAIALVTEDIFSVREAFQACLVDSSLNFESEASFAIQILSKPGNDYALKAAYNNPQSVKDAVTNVAAMGLSLNPALKHAYLIPRKVGDKTVIVLDISFMGLVELATAGGGVTFVQARVVHKNDSFKDNGPGQMPEHSCNPFATDRGPVVGAYVVAKLASGDYLTETMSVAQINDIRDRSDAWKKFAKKEIKSCPWSTDWEEMAKKTVVKRAAKYWPKTERLDRATHYLNTDGGEGLADMDHGAPQGPGPQHGAGDAAVSAEEWIQRACKTHTEPDLMKVYADATAAFAKTKDRDGYAKFKNAAVARRHEIRNNTIDMKDAA